MTQPSANKNRSTLQHRLPVDPDGFPGLHHKSLGRALWVPGGRRVLPPSRHLPHHVALQRPARHHPRGGPRGLPVGQQNTIRTRTPQASQRRFRSKV